MARRGYAGAGRHGVSSVFGYDFEHEHEHKDRRAADEVKQGRDGEAGHAVAQESEAAEPKDSGDCQQREEA